MQDSFEIDGLLVMVSSNFAIITLNISLFSHLFHEVRKTIRSSGIGFTLYVILHSPHR